MPASGKGPTERAKQWAKDNLENVEGAKLHKHGMCVAGAAPRRAGVGAEPRGASAAAEPRASSVAVRAVQAQVGCKYEPNIHNMTIFFDLREATFQHFSPRIEARMHVGVLTSV